MTASTLALVSCLMNSLPASAVDRGPAVYDGSNHDRVYLPLGDRAFVDEVIEYKLDKSKPPDHWRQTKAALGRPNYVSQLVDEESPTPSYVALGASGSITFRFTDNALVDIPGPDLYIWEVPQGEEKDALSVEISEDGKEWLKVGIADPTNPRLDIANASKPGQVFHYVRLTDNSNLTKGEQFPGGDIDAVAAIGSAPKMVIDNAAIFETDSDKLTAGAAKQLDAASDLIKSVKSKSVIVQSHSDKTNATDDVTSLEELSKKRATAVKNYLVEKDKLNADDVKIEPYGYSRTIVPSTTKTGRARNNRIEIVFVPVVRDSVITAKSPRIPELIDGTWNSSMGPVILVARKDDKDGKILVHGEWLPNQGRVGVIQSGIFNPDSGVLDVEWYQKWNNLRGNSKFQLSMNGKKLRGSAKNDRNEIIDWVLTRDE